MNIIYITSNNLKFNLKKIMYKSFKYMLLKTTLYIKNNIHF